MKKSELKMAVKKAMKPYYKNGLTNTAHVLETSLFKSIDRAYSRKHKTT